MKGFGSGPARSGCNRADGHPVKAALILAVLILIFHCSPARLLGAPGGTVSGESQDGISQYGISEYEAYRQRFDTIDATEDIDSHGFEMIGPEVFYFELEGTGEVAVTLTFDRQYSRLAVFVADAEGHIVYKTDQLETNNQTAGTLKQPNERLAAASFRDLNGDGLTDIVLISSCGYGTRSNTGKSYKVGDVLFQKNGTFYRDYRISDQINRFSMNKSIHFITSFVRDGYSTEFLYTSNTQKELEDGGLEIIPDHYYPVKFEKLGRLQVVPGTYRMAEYTVFTLYLVNEQGYIVWSFQPMGNYENLYGLRGINCRDIDGDGLKDIVVLASYSYEGSTGESVVESDYSLYYQRTGGFYEDTDIKRTIQCSDSDTMSDLVERLRAYWGWRSEDDKSTDSG